MIEDYVSFENAKLLKEKGFDEECYRFWQYDKANNKDDTDGISLSECNVYLPLCNSKIDYLFKDKLMSSGYSAPTLQMAMKWLRENHNLYITSVPNGIGENVFYMSIYRKYDYGWTHISDCLDEEYKEAEFSSPEEACDAAIKYCLEKLI